MMWSQFGHIQVAKILRLENSEAGRKSYKMSLVNTQSFGLQQETNSGLPGQSQGRPLPHVSFSTLHDHLLL